MLYYLVIFCFNIQIMVDNKNNNNNISKEQQKTTLLVLQLQDSFFNLSQYSPFEITLTRFLLKYAHRNPISTQFHFVYHFWWKRF